MPSQGWISSPTPSAAATASERDGIGPRIKRRRACSAVRTVFFGIGSPRELLARDDVDADIAGPAHQVVHDRAVQDLEPARSRRFADDDLGDVVGVREADHVVGDAPVAARDGDRLAAERFGEPQRVGDAVALLLGELQAAPCLDVERGPRRMQPIGQPLGVAHKARGARILADADQNALARRPGPGMACACIWVSNCSSTRSAVRRSASSRKRRQVAGRKEMLERALGLLGDVDLAFLQALDQIVGREVDELDGVGAVEDRIRHGLAHAHVRDLGDDVVQALDVLDVDAWCRRRCRG